MNAMVLNEIAPVESSPLVWQQVDDPQPGPGQVRLAVRCCAICRTDLHVIEGELPRQKLPIIPGHQIVGVVDRLGPGCTRLRVGQRVGVAWLRHTCGRCSYCTAGKENLCDSQRFTGYHADGGYAELAVVDEDFAYEIPDGFDDVQAAPLLCAGIVGYRALKRSNLFAGGRLAIFGFGSSAHVIMQIALHRGCRVYVVTRGASHRDLALRMGAAWASEIAAGMPDHVDSAIIFAPAGSLVPDALTCLDKGGTLALAGIYMTDVPTLDYERHLFYERQVRSVTANTRQDGQELLAEAAAIPIRPHTTTYPLREANQALQDLKADRINGTGVLVI
ncbi:MAG: Alcohol dehydrogenase [Planctomycetes bacterium ADurb.Bin126]|nr:MAG: Alcohol dehydrogenase [Planctomycetes bacterium ADurb.Bin126]HOD83599.1 zinc-dependent alcohol dehydrogenase family protein [Phycisphaerae bacterium]HQL71965.1 zinc-dependent alcohol dehydrogenase family protein [Phycisphaerae bacterium]